MNEDDIRREWGERGFDPGVCTDGPGEVRHDLVHDADELFMVVEGSVEIDIAGLNHRPKIGEEIVIPAHTIHTVRNAGDIPSRWLYGSLRPRSR